MLAPELARRAEERGAAMRVATAAGGQLQRGHPIPRAGNSAGVIGRLAAALASTVTAAGPVVRSAVPAGGCDAHAGLPATAGQARGRDSMKP